LNRRGFAVIRVEDGHQLRHLQHFLELRSEVRQLQRSALRTRAVERRDERDAQKERGVPVRHVQEVELLRASRLREPGLLGKRIGRHRLLELDHLDAALVLRLNLPAIQAANWASAPLQLLLFIPYMRAGEFLTRAKPLPLSIAQITAMFHADFWGSLARLWGSILRATLGWAVAAPLEVLVIYAVLLPLLRLIPALPQEQPAGPPGLSSASAPEKDA